MAKRYSGYFKFPTVLLLEEYQVHVDCNGWSDLNYGVLTNDNTRSDFILFTEEQLDNFAALARQYQGRMNITRCCDSLEDRAVAVAVRQFFCNLETDEQALKMYLRLKEQAEEDPDSFMDCDEFPVWSAAEHEPVSELLPLVDYLAADVKKAIIGYSDCFPANHKLFRGCTQFMWCEVALVEDEVVRLYENPYSVFNPACTFFTLYGRESAAVECLALIDGTYEYISKQAQFLREDGLEGADVCFISRTGEVIYE